MTRLQAVPCVENDTYQLEAAVEGQTPPSFRYLFGWVVCWFWKLLNIQKKIVISGGNCYSRLHLDSMLCCLNVNCLFHRDPP